jgi:bifunctional DNA-binding transcriptional regulator/antitoxin component of YhaV-PrlF toxin-antitoxin module
LNKDLILAKVRKERAYEAYMAKVTSKYQVTVPRRIAEEYQIQPGDDIEWVSAGDVIRVIPAGKKEAFVGNDARLRWFDQATERHRKRPVPPVTRQPRDRGWSREDLYGRGRSR